jgi:hypothetical protein
LAIRLKQGRRSAKKSDIPADYTFDSISELSEFFKNSVTGPSPQPL